MNALELRQKMNKKRPKFKRASTSNRKEVKSTWRTPAGIHNKQRKRTHKGPMVQPGYRNPKAVRGTLPDGNPTVLVQTLKQLENIKSCILGHVGMKRRKELLIKAKEKGVKIWNYDIEKELARIDSKRKEKKQPKKEEEPKQAKTVAPKTPEEQKEEDQQQTQKLIIKPQ